MSHNLSPERILELALKAQKAAEKAYAPYSNFRVGAVAVDDQGREFTGCNVENAAYPAGLCGEDLAVCKAVSEGARKVPIVSVACLDAATLDNCFPCGLSCQRLSEFGVETVIASIPNHPPRVYAFSELMPHQFHL